MNRLLAASSLAPAIALFALSTRSAGATALLGAIALAAALLSGRVRASAALLRLTSGAALAAGLALAPFLLSDAPGLAGRGTRGMLYGMAALSTLLSAAARRPFASSDEERRVDVSLEAAALIACGTRQVGPLYPALAATWLALVLLSQRSRRPGTGRALELQRPAASLAVLTLTAGITVALGLGLPRAAQRIEERFGAWLTHGRAKSGFADTVRLGALDGLLRSDTVVMRLWGPAPEYLRGAAYDRYTFGYWSRSDGALTRVTTRTVPPEGRYVEARFATRPERYFLPLGAGSVSTPSGVALRDGGDALRPLPGESPDAYGFAPEGARSARVGEAPDLGHLDVPAPMKERLTALAAEWTGALQGPREKAEALAERLRRGYAYSLESRRAPGVDPVADFLFREKQGHCEYFASALGLLARASGVPSRVVTGYRVTEENLLGGYHVVRERDAHAWVEVWLPGEGWRTLDATPPVELRSTPFAAALGDAAVTRIGRALARLRDLSLVQSALLLASAVALFAGVRAWNARRRRRPRRRRTAAVGPPAWFERFERALVHAGHPRTPSEPLERFARRISSSEPGAAALIERYAALRYGGVGDGAALARDMESCAARLRALPGPTGP